MGLLLHAHGRIDFLLGQADSFFLKYPVKYHTGRHTAVVRGRSSPIKHNHLNVVHFRHIQHSLPLHAVLCRYLLLRINYKRHNTASSSAFLSTVCKRQRKKPQVLYLRFLHIKITTESRFLCCGTVPSPQGKHGHPSAADPPARAREPRAWSIVPACWSP